MSNIRVNITKKFPQREEQIAYEFCIDTNQLITVVGSSGCGKSTLLRMLAGLTDPTQGKIEIEGQTWYSSEEKINIPTQQRDIGFVFQNYSLFPNMTVHDNFRYVCKEHLFSRKIKPQDNKRIDDIIELLELGEVLHAYPATLSGGQQQRVALGRAIIGKPKLLLLDEPLSALDAEMRAKLQKEILKIQNYYDITTILVSHSLQEIFLLSDTVVVVKNGHIKDIGKPMDVLFDTSMSNKISLTGEILSIDNVDTMQIAVVAVGNQVGSVVLGAESDNDIAIGDNVILSMKAFSPIVIKPEQQGYHHEKMEAL